LETPNLSIIQVTYCPFYWSQGDLKIAKLYARS